MAHGSIGKGRPRPADYLAGTNFWPVTAGIGFSERGLRILARRRASARPWDGPARINHSRRAALILGWRCAGRSEERPLRRRQLFAVIGAGEQVPVTVRGHLDRGVP